MAKLFTFWVHIFGREDQVSGFQDGYVRVVWILVNKDCRLDIIYHPSIEKYIPCHSCEVCEGNARYSYTR